MVPCKEVPILNLHALIIFRMVERERENRYNPYIGKVIYIASFLKLLCLRKDRFCEILFLPYRKRLRFSLTKIILSFIFLFFYSFNLVHCTFLSYSYLLVEFLQRERCMY
jgi:hypothetical protein